MRKFAFIYLNTGGGHRSAANVLKQSLTEADKDVSVTMINAFEQYNSLGTFFFEDFYHFSTNWAPGLYSGSYRFLQDRRFQKLTLTFVNPGLEKYLAQEFEKAEPTDIVVFHFLIVDAVKRVLAKTGRKANVSVIVLDPFTCHSSWFYRKDVNYLVYSEDVRKEGIAQGVPENQIQVIPFLLGKKFRTPATADEIAMLKKKHNLPEDRKILLVSGGGEGLPNMMAIANECVLRKEKFTLCVVCGRDHTAKKAIDLLAAKERAFSVSDSKVDIRAYGFVDFMDELVKCCDCAVIKAGPASLVEVLAQQKPVVLCHFIYGQEVGNVDFAIKNKIGVFKRKPGDILDYVEKLFGDESYYASVQKNAKTLPLDVNCDKITEVLLKK